MSKSVKRSTASIAAAAATTPQAKNDPKYKCDEAASKQSRVIAMLSSPAGATIAAIVQATDWQQHSVRGFLAGVVRKRLKLELESRKVDNGRVYRIIGGTARRSKARPSKRQSS